MEMNSTQNSLNIATGRLQNSLKNHVNSINIKLKESEAEVKLLQEENQQLKVSIETNVHLLY